MPVWLLTNWLECVRNRKTPADIRIGYNPSIRVAMTVAALHTGRDTTFKEARQEVEFG